MSRVMNEVMNEAEALEFIGRYIKANIDEIENFFYEGMQEDTEEEEAKVKGDIAIILKVAATISGEGY